MNALFLLFYMFLSSQVFIFFPHCGSVMDALYCVVLF